MKARCSDDQKNTLIKQHRAGTPIKDICAEAGISRSTFYNWLNKYSPITTETEKKITVRDFELQKKHIEKLGNIISVSKSVDCTVSSPLQDRLNALELLHGQYSVHVLCEALDVSRGTFYNYISRNKREDTVYAARKEEFKKEIQKIYDDNRQLFGADKITAVMRNHGFTVSKKYVLRLMREMGLHSISPIAKKKYQKWQKGQNRNIVQQQFSATQPDTVWVSDVTVYRFQEKYYYICAILDLFSRKVVAYRVSKANSTQLVTKTFRQALHKRQPPAGLTFHSDRGTPYLSRAFRMLLEENKIVQSLSRPGKPHDNAVMESFFSYLKKEELYRHEYRSEAALLSGIDRYMLFYNNLRPHSTLQYKTPDQVEAAYQE